MTIDIFYNTYTERLLDRTFNACRTVLQSPLECSYAVSVVSEQAHLDYETTKECMKRLAYDGTLLHRDGKFVFAR